MRFLADESETLAFGQECSRLFTHPCIVYLNGDLGAGKTTFTRGFLSGLGYSGTVKSPTYAIVESYLLVAQSVQHFDLYRFNSPDEWEDAGLDDLVPNSICLIEWPQKGGNYVPAADYIIELTAQETGRHLTLIAQTEQAKKELLRWQT